MIVGGSAHFYVPEFAASSRSRYAVLVREGAKYDTKGEQGAGIASTGYISCQVGILEVFSRGRCDLMHWRHMRTVQWGYRTMIQLSILPVLYSLVLSAEFNTRDAR